MDLAQPFKHENECIYLNYHFNEGYETILDSDKRIQVTAGWFYKNFITKNTPVVIVGGAKQWPAISRWTTEYLKNKLGETEVKVSIGNKTDSSFGLISKTVRTDMPFSRFVDLMDSSDETQYYLNLQRNSYVDDSGKRVESDLDIAYTFFKDDFVDPPFMKHFRIKETNFWMGPDELVSRLHHDASENVLCMVHGTKRFVLFPPSQSKYLYPFKEKQKHFSQVDIDHPDYEQFPLLKKASPTECIAHQGDMLFVAVLHNFDTCPRCLSHEEILQRRQRINGL